MSAVKSLVSSLAPVALAASLVLAPAGAQAGGTLIWGTPAEADALDPHAMGGWIGRSITRQIYESLLDEDLSDPKATSVKLKPVLAKDYEITEGGKVWTFTLREGVKFHDGSPFDADAVKFNFDRFLDEKAPQYYPKAKGFIVGFASWIDKVEALDKYKIRVTLKKPNYEWFQSGLQPYGVFLIISPAAIKKYGNDQIALHPTGTGKFKFVEREQGVKTVLERNDDYWGDKAKLDKIVVRVLADPTTRVNALLANEVNFITTPPWDEIEGLKNAGYQLLTNENVPSIWYVSINTRHPILKDKRVRQALNYALNREELAKAVFQGTATPAWGILSRGTPAFDPNFRAYEYNPDKAKKLLAEAGYPNGFDITYQIPQYGSGELWEQWLQRDLKKIGVNATIQKFEWISYMHEWTQGLKETVGINEMGWGESIPSWVARQTRCDVAPPNGTNVGWYCNKEVDALYDKAIAESDPSKAVEYYRKAQEIISDDAAFIPVVNDEQPVFISPKVHGFVNPAQDWFDFSTVSVDP
jgi:peptide/nickel transport system substrate-binding protein